jgi:hypothetical protein
LSVCRFFILQQRERDREKEKESVFINNVCVLEKNVVCVDVMHIEYVCVCQSDRNRKRKKEKEKER